MTMTVPYIYMPKLTCNTSLSALGNTSSDVGSPLHLIQDRPAVLLVVLTNIWLEHIDDYQFEVSYTLFGLSITFKHNH